MTLFYSKSTSGFYDSEINKKIPADAKEITKEEHEGLMLAQVTGQKIIPGKDGKPTTEDAPDIQIDIGIENIIDKEVEIKKIEDHFKNTLDKGLVECFALGALHSYYIDNESRDWISFVIATGCDSKLTCIDTTGLELRKSHNNYQLRQVAKAILLKIESEYTLCEKSKEELKIKYGDIIDINTKGGI